MTEAQLAHNKQVAIERIFIEQAIGGIKRLRILCQRISLKGDKVLNRIFSVTAAIWNFDLKT